MAAVIEIAQRQSKRARLRAASVARGYIVECPVLGLIKPCQCAAHRKRGFAATNPTRVALYRACPTCPNNQRRK